MPGEKKGRNEKEERTCTFKTHDGKPCRRILHDDKHCIFHSEDIEGKKDKFNDEFWKEFERQKEHEEKYVFRGFIFPGDISFNSKEFEKDVDFLDAQFSGEANFGEAQFSGEAAFVRAQFSGNAHFWRARFSGVAYFGSARFSGKAYFGVAQFSGEAYFGVAQFSGAAYFGSAQFSGAAYFGSAQFSGEAYFGVAQFSGAADSVRAQFSGAADFMRAQFSGKAYFVRAQFSGAADFRSAQFSGAADFGGAQFSGEVNFSGAEFHSKSFFMEVKFEDLNQLNMINTSFYNVFGLLEYIAENRNKFKRSKGIKYLHDTCKPILGETTVSRLPLLSREIKDDVYLMSFKKKHPTIHFIWWLFADCGRSFSRWALWSIIFAVLFAYLFFSMGTEAFSISKLPFSFETMLYYSLVTFTTLGFGDVIPNTAEASRLVMLEVILGYIMLGGLISILANKLARRS